MELKISNLPIEVVKKLNSEIGKEIQIVLTGKEHNIKIKNNLVFSNYSLGTETTIIFDEESVEVKKIESIEISGTYIECQTQFSSKDCNDCSLKIQEGCGKIREDIMNFYLGKI